MAHARKPVLSGRPVADPSTDVCAQSGFVGPSARAKLGLDAAYPPVRRVTYSAKDCKGRVTVDEADQLRDAQVTWLREVDELVEVVQRCAPQVDLSEAKRMIEHGEVIIGRTCLGTWTSSRTITSDKRAG